jgi:hypothetical protein
VPDTTEPAPDTTAEEETRQPPKDVLCENGINSFTGRSCACESGCYVCHYDQGRLAPTAGGCLRCKSQQYLSNGVCVQSCPGGQIAYGSGVFGRQCLHVQ